MIYRRNIHISLVRLVNARLFSASSTSIAIAMQTEMNKEERFEQITKVLRNNPNMTRAKARRIIDVLKEMQKSVPASGESDESNFLNELEAEIDGMSWRNKLTWTPTYYEYLAFYGVAVLIVAIFGFFGYKLYKSLTERQRKREEKQKAKQLKSKKK